MLQKLSRFDARKNPLEIVKGVDEVPWERDAGGGVEVVIHKV
jgi:hypothetical protein